MTFIDAIKSENLAAIRSFPKSDLHNHFVLGGSREYILGKTGYEISPISEPLKSMSEMDAWSGKYIGNRFNSPEGRRLLIEATFEQVKRDGVTILEIGEDVWGLGEFFHNDIEELIDAGELFAPDEYQECLEAFKDRGAVVKALCLHIAHDCNLACRYCFAEEGEQAASSAACSG